MMISNKTSTGLELYGGKRGMLGLGGGVIEEIIQ